jgi:hypothetical protein
VAATTSFPEYDSNCAVCSVLKHGWKIGICVPGYPLPADQYSSIFYSIYPGYSGIVRKSRPRCWARLAWLRCRPAVAYQLRPAVPAHTRPLCTRCTEEAVARRGLTADRQQVASGAQSSEGGCSCDSGSRSEGAALRGACPV